MIDETGLYDIWNTCLNSPYSNEHEGIEHFLMVMKNKTWEPKVQILIIQNTNDTYIRCGNNNWNSWKQFAYVS